MLSRGTAKSVVMILLAALCLSMTAVGCGTGPTNVEYVITVYGEEVGAASVSVKETCGKRTYTGTERRPFLACDSIFEHRLTVGSDAGVLGEYSGEHTVPGAGYRTDISKEGDGYRYLADRLQTFDYVSNLSSEQCLLPLEPDSPCLLQALLDRFLEAGAGEETALVVLPSGPAVTQAIRLERGGGETVKVSGDSVGELDLSVDEDGVLLGVSGPGGLEIKRGGTGPTGSKPYAPRAAARVIDIRIPVGEMELAGSLYVPRGEKPYPAVVLAADFGPLDRTGAGFMSQVADRLAGEGMAVLTCDKRGVPYSDGEYGTYTLGSAVEDMNTQVDYLSLRGDIDHDRIFAVGYGEGGTIVAGAAESNPYIAACVLMASPSVRMFPDGAREYAGRMAAIGKLTPPEAEAAERNISDLERTLDQCADEVLELNGRELYLGWMRSYERSNPLVTAGSLKVPVLVMQGGADEQVPASQATEIMEVLRSRENGEQELILYPELGHDFGRQVNEGEARPYRAHPLIDEQVLGDMTRWLKER